MKISSEYNLTKNEFMKFKQFQQNIINLADNIKDDVEQMAAYDAYEVADKLAELYQGYMISNGSSDILSLDDIMNDEDNTGKSVVKLHRNRKDAKNKWSGAPKITVNPTKTGFTVSMQGKDIIYQEFGTGLIAEGTYPGKLPADWEYASGQFVLQGGEYRNRSTVNNSIPKWYKKALEKGKIRESDAVWKSPRGVTRGNVAGHFMYDTFEELAEEMITSTQSNLQLGRKNIQVYVKNKLLEGVDD